MGVLDLLQGKSGILVFYPIGVAGVGDGSITVTHTVYPISYDLTENWEFSPRVLNAVIPLYPLFTPEVGMTVQVWIQGELIPKFTGVVWDCDFDASGETGYTITAYDIVKYLEGEEWDEYSGSMGECFAAMCTKLQLPFVPVPTIGNVEKKVYQGSFLSILKEFSNATISASGIYYRPYCLPTGQLTLKIVGAGVMSTIIHEGMTTSFHVRTSLADTFTRFRMVDTSSGEGATASATTVDAPSAIAYGHIQKVDEINKTYSPVTLGAALVRRYAKRTTNIDIHFVGTARYAARVGDTAVVVAHGTTAALTITSCRITNTGEDDHMEVTLTNEIWG